MMKPSDPTFKLYLRSCRLLSRFSHALVVAVVIAYGVQGADWAQWRGPHHDGHSIERSGWPDLWPPQLLWKHNVGRGCTSSLIVKGRVYVMGWQGDFRNRNAQGSDVVYCLDAVTGNELWRQTYACRYWGRFHAGDEGLYGGPSSTPSFDSQTSYLYTLSIDGDLVCWDAKKKGRRVWGLNLYDQYNISQRPEATRRGKRDYGYSGSPQIHSDWVIVEAGGNEGLLMAFDKQTGERQWMSQSKEPGGSNAGPVPMDVQGIPCLASSALRKLVIVPLEEPHLGDTMAEYPWVVDYANNIATPAIAGNRIVLTAGYNQRQTVLLEVTPGGIKAIWHANTFSGINSPVIDQNSLYLVSTGLSCLDLDTGEIRWHGGHLGRDASSVILADEKLLVFAGGSLVLVDIASNVKEYRELARVDHVVGGTSYPHVALSDGIICCKNREGDLVGLALRK